MRDFDIYLKRLEVEKAEGWEQFNRVPPLQLRPEWTIRLLPPSVGALMRCRINCGDMEISIYFDALDRLGAVGQPYWEMYPNGEGDTERFLMGEEDQLMKAVAQAFADRMKLVENEMKQISAAPKES